VRSHQFLKWWGALKLRFCATSRVGPKILSNRDNECDNVTSILHCDKRPLWRAWRVEIKKGCLRLRPCYRSILPAAMITSRDPTYPLFPVFSFLAFIVCLIPLPWHIHAWNSGTCSYMLWTATACLVLFINSIVWSGNVDNPSPVWCDICEFTIMASGRSINLSMLQLRNSFWGLASGSLHLHCALVAVSTI